MPMTKHHTPTPQEVGDFYNKVNHLLAQFQGGSIHYGYWTGPDDQSTFEQASERLTDIVVGKLAPRPGDRVLDLGCGTGKPAIQMARSTGAQVVGVSVSTGDVELGTALASAEGMSEQVTFQHGDAMDLDLPSSSFDAVLAIELVVHVPDRGQVLKEIARVVKPGGRVVLTDFVRSGPEVRNEVVRDGLAETLAALPPRRWPSSRTIQALPRMRVWCSTRSSTSPRTRRASATSRRSKPCGSTPNGMTTSRLS